MQAWDSGKDVCENALSGVSGVSRAASLLAIVAAWGCSGAPSDVYMEAREQPESSTLLFEDQYSEAGVFSVSESADGILAVQVGGRIGEDDPAAVGDIVALDNLEHIYLALHPGAESAPERLVEISERLTAETEAARVTALTEGTADDALVNKSYSGFMSTLCKTFGAATDEWIAANCGYDEAHEVTCQSTSQQGTNDRVYAWNEHATVGGAVRVRDFVNGGQYGDTKRLGAFSWAYFWWSGTYSGANSCFRLDNQALGNIGITHHDWRRVVDPQ
jgi:hypothetical protein